MNNKPIGAEFDSSAPYNQDDECSICGSVNLTEYDDCIICNHCGEVYEK